MPRIDAATAGGANVCAMLDTIAQSEGTSIIQNSDDGYNVIVGGGLFDSYADHPRVFVDLPYLGIKSSAAGRYQILAHIFDFYKAQLNLPDFSPVSQDKIAIQMLKEVHAIGALATGDFTTAVTQASNRWASFPGNSYGQHQNKIADLEHVYEAAGGVVA